MLLGLGESGFGLCEFLLDGCERFGSLVECGCQLLGHRSKWLHAGVWSVDGDVMERIAYFKLEVRA